MWMNLLYSVHVKCIHILCFSECLGSLSPFSLVMSVQFENPELISAEIQGNRSSSSIADIIRVIFVVSDLVPTISCATVEPSS